MSVPRRAYDLLRGYIGREYERIQGVDFDGASQELKEAFQNPMKPGDASPQPPQPRVQATPADRRAQACAVLGVSSKAEFGEIRTAFERLNRRSDPANFPPGSEEGKQAGQIQRRVQDAYRILADQADATEVRFKSLEIE